jgi:crossover junction endodeoxyribonuclease RuvC
MTFRLTCSIDVGITGAIAAFADSEPLRIIDLPTRAREAGGSEIDGYKLAAVLRGIRQEHPGASMLVVIERVYARPARFGGEGGSPGVTSSGKLMQSDGMVRGVVEALGIPIVNVQPQKWKRHFELLGTEKDAARLLAIKLFPQLAGQLARKKDCGRADALLIGAWAEAVEKLAKAA